VDQTRGALKPLHLSADRWHVRTERQTSFRTRLAASKTVQSSLRNTEIKANGFFFANFHNGPGLKGERVCRMDDDGWMDRRRVCVPRSWGIGCFAEEEEYAALVGDWLFRRGGGIKNQILVYWISSDTGKWQSIKSHH
jgi:hypothetical protein